MRSQTSSSAASWDTEKYQNPPLALELVEETTVQDEEPPRGGGLVDCAERLDEERQGTVQRKTRARPADLLTNKTV